MKPMKREAYTNITHKEKFMVCMIDNKRLREN